MAAFNILDRGSGSDLSPFEYNVTALPMGSLCTASTCVWFGVYCINYSSSWAISALGMILHAPTIIMVPLATPEQSSSACRHWSRTRFSPKWIGSNASFKHVIWANARSTSNNRLFLSAVEQTHQLIRRPSEEWIRCCRITDQTTKNLIFNWLHEEKKHSD